MSDAVHVAAAIRQATVAQAPPTPPLTAATSPVASSPWPARDAWFVLRDVRFRSGETLSEVRISYTTVGQPHRDARGQIDDAVMILHVAGGAGRHFINPVFAYGLYGPGQPLGIARYWIIFPDDIGHGKSSKPSDGLRMRFRNTIMTTWWRRNVGRCMTEPESGACASSWALRCGACTLWCGARLIRRSRAH
ncbi:hypothetical protein [Sphingomonas sp. Leaf231]|uniref:hypothetical protein n=1 Tax=Sphingomonas sp. Leaf231 TaxID=1736301 RepID=UPI002E16424B